MRGTICLFVGASAIATFGASFADAQNYGPDIGYTKLANELGASIPTGAGVRVAQVEADASNNSDPYEYVPDTTQFTQTIVTHDSPAKTSGHATTVATYFYGSDSISPGITTVDSYEADFWLQSDFLKTGSSGTLPATPGYRVANNSYVGSFSTAASNVDALSRMDYVVQHDQLINVVAVNNPSNGGPMPIFGDSFNSITVGLTNGTAASGTAAETGIYAPTNRAAPDLVAENGFTSFATPQVSSAATLLVQYADTHPALSKGTVTTRTNGQTLQYAETADVIKAALMAGADRSTSNTVSGDQVTGYGTTAFATTNGLDTRYGAGQLDIYNSYHVIAGGQQGPGTISKFGFDYQNASAQTAEEDYKFTGATGLTATLAWNAHVDSSLNATLAHFVLKLLQVNTDGSTSSVATLSSTVDNTQNLFLQNLTSSSTYEIDVTRADSLGAWDYGLAWDLATVPEPCAMTLSLLSLVTVLRRPRRASNLRSSPAAA